MKFFTLLILAGAVTVGGCASVNDTNVASTASTEQSYTPTGTMIPKKGQPKADPTDMQSFENNRTMNQGINNSGK